MILILAPFVPVSFNDLRFAKSIWMSGTQRGDVGIDALNDELRVAYMDNIEEGVDMAQLEWDSWWHRYGRSI